LTHPTMSESDSSANSEEAYEHFQRNRKRRKQAKTWEKRVHDWNGDPEELLEICRYYEKRERDLQLYDSLSSCSKFKAADMATILDWWHKDPEKRKLLNVMLCCDSDGPEAYMVTCWKALDEEQRKAIKEHGKITPGQAWYHMYEGHSAGYYMEPPSWECIDEIHAVLRKHYDAAK
jgi:hypothetical protein